MDYEKKYKGALARCKWLLSEGMISKIAATDMFRELMDNDENIRKEIINIFHSLAEGKIPVDINYADIFTWLEKQGKKKSTDKVEPKFKVGDWIISKYMHLVMQILNNDNGSYKTVEIDGTERNDSYDFIERNFKLWTIQDAKDGDVLIDKSGSRECPFIFKETKPSDIKTDVPNPLTVLGYCGIGGAGFTKGSGWGDTANCIYYPATKEQRNLLFQKMKEADYEWDAENLQLTKILPVKELSDGINIDKQKLAELSEKDEEYNGEDYGIDGLWHAQRILEKTLGSVDGYQTDDGLLSHQCAITAVKKLYKQKPAWSEEDERNLNDAVLFIETGTYSLDKDNLINWLKSLRPQKQWKPSKEQIIALRWVLNNVPYNKHKEEINGLLDQIKEL